MQVIRLKTAIGLIFGVAGVLLLPLSIFEYLNSKGNIYPLVCHSVMAIAGIGFLISAFSGQRSWLYFQVYAMFFIGILLVFEHADLGYSQLLVLLSVFISYVYELKPEGPYIFIIFGLPLFIAEFVAFSLNDSIHAISNFFGAVLFYAMLTPIAYLAYELWRQKVRETAVNQPTLLNGKVEPDRLTGLVSTLRDKGLTPKEIEICAKLLFFHGNQKEFSLAHQVNIGTLRAHLNHVYEKIGKYNFDDLRKYLRQIVAELDRNNLVISPSSSAGPAQEKQVEML